jgi:hypothetical protein
MSGNDLYRVGPESPSGLWSTCRLLPMCTQPQDLCLPNYEKEEAFPTPTCQGKGWLTGSQIERWTGLISNPKGAPPKGDRHFEGKPRIQPLLDTCCGSCVLVWRVGCEPGLGWECRWGQAVGSLLASGRMRVPSLFIPYPHRRCSLPLSSGRALKSLPQSPL